MIRLGICGPIENIEVVAKMGFDYLEAGLTRLSEIDEAEFRALRDRVQAAPIRVEAFNGMLPAKLRVTGSDVNAQALHEYLDKTFARAKQLGGQIVVFGSSGARNVPDGFPIDMAWRQICNFLRLAERHAIDHDITIAIEPLRRAESNIINMVSEATILASILQLRHVRALADTYSHGHLQRAGECAHAVRQPNRARAHRQSDWARMPQAERRRGLCQNYASPEGRRL